jgi:serine/threonine protein kinase
VTAEDTAPPPPADESPDDVDLRMAEALREDASAAGLRRALRDGTTPVSESLRGRLDALDLLRQVAGGTVGEAPERIGPYEIKGVLGRGGMGTVYLGWQQDLEREVAVKVLSPQLSSDATMQKRFRAEARATAALHHQHIVPIYDFGEVDGVLFFAMERVDGMSLDKHIAAARRVGKKPMAPLEAARRFAGVADALGLAHRRRLLHRDVKPGNLLVARDGTLAVTDFGLAKTLDHASMRLTSKGGGFLGTLHYSSPEQALGAELTPASDLFSLGVTIFEAVTGELPRAATTTESMLHEILYGEPRRLREFVPKPPRDLEAVVDKLLMREPADRYQDGGELARDLQRIADGEPVHIRRLPLHVRLWRRMRKNPVLSGAIAAVFLLALLAVALLFVLRIERVQGLAMRHRVELVAIAQLVGEERGDVAGPAGLLAALTGVDEAAAPASPRVLAAFERAAEASPGDDDVDAMRSAWRDDPAPTATALLREGRGFEAAQELDSAIATAIAERAGRELVVELRLYRLYLARGVARLTAAVARPDDARTDLALAAYLRPGAVFPLALLEALDVVHGGDADARLPRLAQDLAAAAPERLRVVGALLWAASGLQPCPRANLMDFALPYAQRRALHAQASTWLGAPPPDALPEPQPTGLGAALADVCREPMARLGEPEAVQQLVARAAAVVEAATAPDAPLRSWRAALDMVAQPPARGAAARDDGRTPEQRLAAFERFLQLEPSRVLAALWLPRFEALRVAYPNLAGMARAAARMHLAAGSPNAAAMAAAWVVAADGDPAARLCRVRAALQAGDLAQARDDAIVVVQEAIDAGAAIDAVVAACRDAERALPAGAVEAVRLLAQQFDDARAELDAAGRTR